MSPDIKKTMEEKDKGMRTEYDFTGGVRGKHHRAMQAGYSVTVHQADGTSVTKEVVPTDGAVILEPDLRAYFPDSESVNKALRCLIPLLSRRDLTTGKL
ncbi:hypothetical protein H206_02656 [Candidatus Electrothrix aarhusensis]|uniref:Uncharacterized protein n=1 Tax=Candidatus Electrothrix aarhusensis TaxID=1859131 RepID=A0A444IXT6_9BACT|nr:hypothetical protein H206_02656 [Candidatus Electrothrix aarhusensis]